MIDKNTHTKKLLTKNKQAKTTTEIQVPGLGQARGGVQARKYVAWLNRLVSAQSPPNLGQGCGRTALKQTIKNPQKRDTRNIYNNKYYKILKIIDSKIYSQFLSASSKPKSNG